MESKAEYTLQSLQLPTLRGRMLRVAARVLEGPIRGPLIRRFLADGGIDALRRVHPSESPTPLPLAFDGQRADTESRIPIPAAPRGVSSSHVTVASLATAYRSGEVTPIEIAERSLAAIRAADEGDLPLRAFIAVDEEDVIAQATAAAARFAEGKPRSSLDGVPVAIKDEVDQRGYPTTVGTSFLGAAVAERDATVVSRLRKAGAVLLGKANMHEIGINPNGLNIHHGQVRNPYDRTRDPGGSSSGSAAAVAAGICPLAIGADGGGSVRIPAALCGVFGLKATFGRISEHGAAPLAWSVGHLGPIGASAHCVAAGYAAIAGPDLGDVNSLHQPAPSIDDWDADDLSGIRVGVYDAWFDHAADEIVAANRQALEHLTAAGAELVAIEIGELENMRIAHAVTILSEMVTAMASHRDQHARDFAPATRVSMALGRAFSSTDYLTAQQIRTRAMAVFTEVFREVDLIATPATGATAPEILDGGDHGYSDLTAVTELMRFIVPGNFVGLPAIAVPIERDSSGLPIGMQLMANHWNEALLLRGAHVLERSRELEPPDDYVRLL
jgi:Asp-tRNA(Asn)/Glu-tRNA(Gln) amidotransferase A subunit family amidase